MDTTTTNQDAPVPYRLVKLPDPTESDVRLLRNILATRCFTVKQVKTLMIQEAIKANGGNMAAAARVLGIGRTTIYRLLGK